MKVFYLSKDVEQLVLQTSVHVPLVTSESRLGREALLTLSTEKSGLAILHFNLLHVTKVEE